ncbi:MAG: hypothetical protein U9R02_10045 [Thermodesulfobacteriota bacterium]|nr:hypothetical protein [Thermodesulfobacteriota bacterium]
MDSYIADLKAATQLDIDLKIFHMNHLGMPQDRIAKRLGALQQTISDHLLKMATLPNPVNTDLSQGFAVTQVAEKHNWTEPMACPPSLSPKGGSQRHPRRSLRRGGRAGAHPRATLQRRSRLRNAKEKDTWSDKQVCDNS